LGWGLRILFDKITKKFTKKIIDNAKETVKKEISTSIDKQIPVIFGLISICVIVCSFIEPKKARIPESTITIINNYYF
jgi:uncharacterized membrane protein YheB (UPF0754 family)